MIALGGRVTMPVPDADETGWQRVTTWPVDEIVTSPRCALPKPGVGDGESAGRSTTVLHPQSPAMLSTTPETSNRRKRRMAENASTLDLRNFALGSGRFGRLQLL